MKKFLAMVFFCLPAFGQATYSGLGVFSASAQYASGGVPQTYSARTDNCATGSESGCVSGKTTGEAGSVLIFQEGPSDPVPFHRPDADLTPGNCSSYTPSSAADCATAGTPFVDSDFSSYSIFVTDQTTAVSTTVFSMGSDGGYDAFGLGYANDVLMTWQNSGSVPYLAHIREADFLAHACATSSCIVLSNIQGASCTPSSTSYTNPHCTQQQISSGTITFSRKANDPANTLYELALPLVYRDTFTTGSTMGVNDSVSRAPYVNFSADGLDGTSIPCHVLPSDYQSTWSGSFSLSDGGAMTISMAGGGSYQTINEQPGVTAGSGSTFVIAGNDAFIMPLNNQPTGGNWMFQASAGTTSGTEPDWAAQCATQGSTCTDGSATWTNIGKVGTQGPGFDTVHFDPAYGCRRTNSRLGKTYNGTGVTYPAGNWITDDAAVCYRMGGTNCGTGRTVALTDKFTLHAGLQTYNSEYGEITPTGGGALNKNYAGGGGSWPEISATPNGSCNTTIDYTSFASWPNPTWVSGSSYPSGVYVASPSDHNYYENILTSSGDTADPSLDPTHWTFAGHYCYVYIIDWTNGTGPMVRPILELGPNFGADGHNAQGYNADFRGGVYWSHNFSQPNCQAGSCSSGYVGAPNPGVQALAVSLPNDGHPTSRNNSMSDLQPIFDPTASVPSWGGVGLATLCGGGTNASGYCAAGYNEEIAFNPNGLSKASIVSISGNGTTATVVTSSSLSAVVGEPLLIAGTVHYNSVYSLQTVNNATNTYTFPATATATETAGSATIQAFYRFGHNYNTGSNPGFGIQNAVGVISQDGRMLAYTSDFMNTRGDHGTGSATCASPLRGQYAPSAGQPVTYLDYMLPITDNKPQDIYPAAGFWNSATSTYTTGGSGAEGSNIPNWNTGCPNLGNYCTTDGTTTTPPLDGNVLWNNLGPNGCRGDVGLMDVTSAHAAP